MDSFVADGCNHLRYISISSSHSIDLFVLLYIYIYICKFYPEYVFMYASQCVKFCLVNCFFAKRYPPPNECPAYDTKQSDGELWVMLELWGMQSTPLLLSLPGPFWPGVVAPDRVLSMGQIELNSVLMLRWIVLNRTVFDIYVAQLC